MLVSTRLRDHLDGRGVDAGQRVLLHALAEDRAAGGEVGRLDVGHEAGLETLPQAVLERVEIPRETVRRQHELRAGALERVEGVEELLLGPGLALEELDVVDEEDADAPVHGLEGLERAGVQRAHELVGEGLGGRVEDAEPVAVVGDVVGDRVQEMRLAEAGRAADEERVVREARHLGDREGGGVGEAVRVADHELVEREAGIEGGAREGARPLHRGRLFVTGDELDARAGAEDGLRAGGDQPREAGLDPGSALGGRLDDERPGVRARAPSAARARVARSCPLPHAASRCGCAAKRVEGGRRARARGRASPRRRSWV